MIAFSETADVIQSSSNIALACHVNPDGDALGSMLGLFHVLRAQGKEVVASFPTPFIVAPPYKSLPGLDKLVPPEKFPANPDVMITFDCGALNRLGDLKEAAVKAQQLIVVDHHLSNEGFGTINLIDPDAAASAVVTRELIHALGLPLNRDAALCLYVALICDTGRFAYDSTKPSVFELAAELASFDLPIAELTRTIFEEHSFAYMQLLGEVLQHMVFSPVHHFVWAAITQQQLAKYGVSYEEIDETIDVIRQTSEAEVAAVFKEQPDGSWRGSLRSLGRVNVEAIAAQFHGGGHKYAAGFTTKHSLESIVATIESALAND